MRKNSEGNSPNLDDISGILTITRTLYHKTLAELRDKGTIEGRAPTQSDIETLNRTRRTLESYTCK